MGNETEIALEDFIDVGVFDEEGDLQYLDKHKILSGENTIKVMVGKRPSKGGIDPLTKLIDKVSRNNLCEADLKKVNL